MTYLKLELMDSLSFKIRELEIQISVFLKRLEEDKENSKKIEFEINQVKTARVTANCILTNENRIIEESSTRLKKIHNAYQKMSKSATQDHQYVISNLAKELSQKKYQLESQVNDLKLKQEKEKKELEKIKLQVIIQNVST